MPVLEPLAVCSSSSSKERIPRRMRLTMSMARPTEVTQCEQARTCQRRGGLRQLGVSLALRQAVATLTTHLFLCPRFQRERPSGD
mmetsp:Transcript_15246/g.36275  ORF Transcript_15246/g.36275 Transcript_15246/m.36275 type:complete len:85 (+) Transcript_15246:254-508(+)